MLLEADVVSFQSAKFELFVPWVQGQFRTSCPGAATLTLLSGAGKYSWSPVTQGLSQ